MPELQGKTSPYISFDGQVIKVSQKKAFIGGAFNGAERAELLNSNFVDDFNTYKNWKDFELFLPGEKEGNGIKATGKKSLFNNLSGLTKMGITPNVPLLDNPMADNSTGSFMSSNAAVRRKQTDCSIKSLVQDSQAGNMGISYYSYADFMYCKDLGKTSNNHLITLRRFAYPCSDEILGINGSEDGDFANHHSTDIGRLISWFGNEDNKIEDILKYSIGMNWKELTADIQEINGNADNASQGILGKVMNTFTNKSYADSAMKGVTEQHNLFGKYSPGGPYSGAEWLSNFDSNKVYGPVDVIRSTNIRDMGLKFEHNITITFDYELRSYNGINPRASLTDLLGNILTVCGNTGRFWGGAVHFIGPAGSNGFQNLAMYNAKNPEEFISGAFADIQKGLGAMMNAMKNPQSSLKSISGMLTNALSVLGGGMLNSLGRPNMYAVKSLLSPAPTGMWHLTIGNPKSPILSCGNLIMENAEISHYGPLGYDDFPTGLKVTVTLKHGKPRDIAGVEHMYTMGRDRIYTPMSSQLKAMFNGGEDSSKGTTTNGANTNPEKAKRYDEGGESNEKKYMYQTNIAQQKGLSKWFGTSNDERILPSAKEMM